MEDRLKLFLTMEGITASQFASKMNIQRSGMTHLLSGRNKPSYDFITKMLMEFPNLNAEWLLLGIGKPYKDSASIGEVSTVVQQPVATQITNSTMEESNNNNLFSSLEKEDENIINEEFIPTKASSKPSENCVNEPSEVGIVKQILVLYSDGRYEIR